jgi:dienelactone hydrolase
MKSMAILVVAVSLAACGGTAMNASNNPVNAVISNASPLPATTSVQTVTIDSPDGVKLVGSFFASNKPNSPAVLLLHQWGSDRHSYDDFAKRMQSVGFAVLSIDGRGFGESTKKADGSTATAGRTDADVKAMLGDVGAAFTFLSKQLNVDPKHVGVVGASYGSSLAIIYAAGDPNVAAVALLSPGLNYFGNVQTKPAIEKYGPKRPLILVAAKDDPDSADSVEKLSKANSDPNAAVSVEIFENGGHGTALLKVGLDKRLEKWLIDTLVNSPENK